MSADKLIYEFSKNTGQKVVIQLREFKGKKLIDVRVLYLSEDGSWRPTPKGICLRRELIHELKQGIDKAAEECEKELSGPEEKGRDYGRAGEKGLEVRMNGGGLGPDQNAKARASREGQAEGTADE